VSWALAKATLVSIVEGVTPTTTKRGLPGAFAHVPELSETQGNARTFRFRIDDLRASGPLMPSAQTLRSIYAVTVEVDYSVDLEPEELDDCIQQDYLAIRGSLLDDSLWGRPSSTIELILPSGNEILPASIKRDEAGARLMITFDLEFRG
jgi:hypothetical protein